MNINGIEQLLPFRHLVCKFSGTKLLKRQQETMENDRRISTIFIVLSFIFYILYGRRKRNANFLIKQFVEYHLSLFSEQRSLDLQWRRIVRTEKLHTPPPFFPGFSVSPCTFLASLFRFFPFVSYIVLNRNCFYICYLTFSATNYLTKEIEEFYQKNNNKLKKKICTKDNEYKNIKRNISI